MKLALCMVVRDEESSLPACLDPIVDLLHEVIVVDTGSRDRTRELLRERYGIVPIERRLDEARCLCVSDSHNAAFDRVSAPWILSLDADERIERTALQSFLALPEDPAIAGYFFPWVTRLPGKLPIEDYKLFAFRRGYRKRGLVHENVQVDLREKGLRARWLADLTVSHHPHRGEDLKMALRERLLRCAIRRKPTWYRYYWFLGYTLYRMGRSGEAALQLRAAAESASRMFPVEVLNSRMVLAELLARIGDRDSSLEQIACARRFYYEVADDFEVQVNFRLRPWLEHAWHLAHEGALSEIRAYDFCS